VFTNNAASHIADVGQPAGYNAGGGSHAVQAKPTVFSGLQVAPEYKPHPPIFA